MWFSQRGPPTALPAFFSELDCAIASTGDRANNFALKNQIYCEFSNSVACQVLIKQRALKKKKPFCPASFSQPLGKAQCCNHILSIVFGQKSSLVGPSTTKNTPKQPKPIQRYSPYVLYKSQRVYFRRQGRRALFSKRLRLKQFNLQQ